MDDLAVFHRRQLIYRVVNMVVGDVTGALNRSLSDAWIRIFQVLQHRDCSRCLEGLKSAITTCAKTT